MKMLFLAACLAVAPYAAGANDAAAPPFVASALASPDRPPADTARDASRHPATLLVFAGIKPGDRVADIMPGQGYFTRIFSNVAGPTGQVYSIVPAELAAVKPKLAELSRALAKEPAFSNVTPLVEPVGAITAGGKLDVAWTSDNYHDVYGFFGPDQAAAMDKAIFNALRPGGVFIVVDHVAKSGSSATSPKTLHRIDPETVKAQALAAGFVLAGDSPALRNPADGHDLIVFSPVVRGHTDQFVFKFRKPN